MPNRSLGEPRVVSWARRFSLLPPATSTGEVFRWALRWPTSGVCQVLPCSMLYTTLSMKFGMAACPEVKDRSLRTAMILDVWAGGRGSGPQGPARRTSAVVGPTASGKMTPQEGATCAPEDRGKKRRTGQEPGGKHWFLKEEILTAKIVKRLGALGF